MDLHAVGTANVFEYYRYWKKEEVRARTLRSWERGTSGRWHIHCAIELPSHFDAIALERLIRDCWAKVAWGHGRILIRDSANAGWIIYIFPTMASRRPASRARVRAARLVNLRNCWQNLAIVVDDPLARCGRPDPVKPTSSSIAPTARAPSSPPNWRTTIPLKRRCRRRPAAAAPARAGRSADRALSRLELEITKKKSATVPPATSPSNPAASCRRTGQADRAGRADRMASRRPASRARVRAARLVNAVSVKPP